MDGEMSFGFIEECDVRDPEMPDIFPLFDEVTIETEFQCPYCHYEWSGQPRVAPGTTIIDVEDAAT